MKIKYTLSLELTRLLLLLDENHSNAWIACNGKLLKYFDDVFHVYRFQNMVGWVVYLSTPDFSLALDELYKKDEGYIRED